MWVPPWAEADGAPTTGTGISIDDFARIELRAGKVLSAQAVPKAKKLLHLSVDLGEPQPRSIVAGIAEAYAPDQIVGRQVIVVANLAPATIRGIRSEGMILAAGEEAIVGLSALDRDVLDGHLGYFIRRVQVWVFQDFIRTLSAIDIRPAQYSVLVVIGANPGLSQSSLAQHLGIERARLVRMLDRLDRRGLTLRLPSDRDRRSHALHLTRDGQKLLKQAKAPAAQHEARLAEKLGPDNRKTVIDILRQFERKPAAKAHTPR